MKNMSSLSAHFSISSGGQKLMKPLRKGHQYHQMDAQWADLFLMLFICLRSGGKKSFVIKSLKQLIDQQRHLNAEKYEDIAKSLRILKTIRIFNQFGCSSNGTLGQRCWLWPERDTLSITTAGLSNGITSTLYVNHDLSFWPFTF